jgi:hypothetical protein
MHVNLATVVVLLISGTNLCGLAYALFQTEKGEPDLHFTRIQLNWAAPLSMILAFLSQALYLVGLAAWVFRWVRFYPGAPIYHTTLIGFALSFFGLVAAFLGIGAKRWISLMVSLTTGLLWILDAIVSAAV